MIPTSLPTGRRRRPSLTAGKIDPRRCAVALDAMVLDRKGTPRDALVDRLLELIDPDKTEIVIREPDVAYRQMQHPRSPAAVRDIMRGQIFTKPTPLNSDEQQLYSQVLGVMRGNSATDQHDDDARIVFDVKKYGGYLVTENSRILKLRHKLHAIPAPAPLWIVSLVEYLDIYDEFIEEEP